MNCRFPATKLIPGFNKMPAITPDQNSTGFLVSAPKAGRYENVSRDPDSVGMKLCKFIPLKSRILDVGCGTGSVSEVVGEQRQASIIGVEPDAERASTARARGLTVYHGFLTEDFIKAHEPFDIILFADVLEHLPDPAGIVQIAKQGLKKGGSVVASVPNVAHWFVRTELLGGNFNYQDCGIMDATHLRWFTEATFRSFWERLGFSVTGFDYTVNIDLPDYRSKRPWRWLRPDMRKKVVSRLVKIAPNLFGCQLVVQAILL
jgi:methionine biosynthesis protein MetW